MLKSKVKNIFSYQKNIFGSFKFEKGGVTLLLVVVLLSTMLSISLGIFNVIYGQFIISGEITDSFKSLYAADHGIERYLYLDRKLGNFNTCTPSPIIPCLSIENIPSFEGCYGVRVKKPDSITTEIVVIGQNQCGASRIVKRGFQVTY